MGTVMAKLVVTSIVEESVHVELQAALFDMKQAVEGVHAQQAASCLSHGAGRRRAWQLLAAHAEPHSTVVVLVWLSDFVGHFGGCLVGLSSVPVRPVRSVTFVVSDHP